jgi:hypothetical protein
LAQPLKKDVEAAVKNCHECQIGKKVRKKYGDLPEKLAERPIAWNRLDVDLIGPLTVKTPSGITELVALTMIDPSTGWFEVKDAKYGYPDIQDLNIKGLIMEENTKMYLKI